MTRSKADRPYGTFDRGLAAEPEPAATARGLRLRARARELARRTRGAQLVGASVVATVTVLALASIVAPPPAPLTERDVHDAITSALASATPKPNAAVAAYEAVKESMVLVKTRLPDEAAPRPRGSGVLLDSGGRIVTSLHILRGAEDIKVVFFDGEEWEAVLGDSQAEFDVAILELGSGGRKPATLASPKGLKVGDTAIVVGSPLGQRNSLTVGVISKLGSTFDPPWPGPRLGGLIQFDAALYPESSGGALVNARGEVVAIVTGGPSLEGLSGLGFAVPIDAAASAAGAAPF